MLPERFTGNHPPISTGSKWGFKFEKLRAAVADAPGSMTARNLFKLFYRGPLGWAYNLYRFQSQKRNSG
jgi:hypothetical protein